MFRISTILMAVLAASAIATAAPLQLNFQDEGGASPAGWVPVTAWSGALHPDLADPADATNTAVSFSVTSQFAESSGNGPDGAYNTWPDLVPNDYWFVDSNNTFGSSDGDATMVLSGLTPNWEYTFSFLAARGGSTGTRSTLYSLDGGTGGTTNDLTLVIGSNAGGDYDEGTVSVTAGDDGVINILVADGNAPGDDSVYGYINGMTVDALPVPEPATMSLLGLGGLALLRRRRR